MSLITKIDKKCNPLQTPVLFLVFNRLDTSMKVFESIRSAKPNKLYIASDGPRVSVRDEKNKVDAVRSYLIENIDWDCELKTLFREDNLGCKLAVSSAISWFFQHEDAGIILEDDIHTSQEFYEYCTLMLDRYKDDERIGQISGFNYEINCKDVEHPYFYSLYGSIWGWATWKRAWKKYDLEMSDYNQLKKENFFRSIFRNDYFKYIQLFDKTHNGSIDTWDYQWFFTRLKHNMFSVTPKINMVENIGFSREDATHTLGPNPFKGLPKETNDINKFRPNVFFERSYTFDSHFWNSGKLLRRMLKFLKQFFHK